MPDTDLLTRVRPLGHGRLLTTVLVVTQRRPIAEQADKIMVMRAGSLVDYGPRAEVIARQQSLAGGQAGPA